MEQRLHSGATPAAIAWHKAIDSSLANSAHAIVLAIPLEQTNPGTSQIMLRPHRELSSAFAVTASGAIIGLGFDPAIGEVGNFTVTEEARPARQGRPDELRPDQINIVHGTIRTAYGPNRNDATGATGADVERLTGIAQAQMHTLPGPLPDLLETKAAVGLCMLGPPTAPPPDMVALVVDHVQRTPVDDGALVLDIVAVLGSSLHRPAAVASRAWARQWPIALTRLDRMCESCVAHALNGLSNRVGVYFGPWEPRPAHFSNRLRLLLIDPVSPPRSGPIMVECNGESTLIRDGAFEFPESPAGSKVVFEMRREERAAVDASAPGSSRAGVECALGYHAYRWDRSSQPPKTVPHHTLSSPTRHEWEAEPWRVVVWVRDDGTRIGAPQAKINAKGKLFVSNEWEERLRGAGWIAAADHWLVENARQQDKGALAWLNCLFGGAGLDDIDAVQMRNAEESVTRFSPSRCDALMRRMIEKARSSRTRSDLDLAGKWIEALAAEVTDEDDKAMLEWLREMAGHVLIAGCTEELIAQVLQQANGVTAARCMRIIRSIIEKRRPSALRIDAGGTFNVWKCSCGHHLCAEHHRLSAWDPTSIAEGFLKMVAAAAERPPAAAEDRPPTGTDYWRVVAHAAEEQRAGRPLAYLPLVAFIYAAITGWYGPIATKSFTGGMLYALAVSEGW